jgi:hypothetical protein
MRRKLTEKKVLILKQEVNEDLVGTLTSQEGKHVLKTNGI